MLTGVTSRNAPYYSFEIADTSIKFNQNYTIWAKGGDDGTMNLTDFSHDVGVKVTEYLNPNSLLQQSAYHCETFIHDSGFVLEDKYKLMSFISRRKDTAIVLSTYTVGGRELSVGEESSIGRALSIRAMLYPESVYYGTTTCRAAVFSGYGECKAARYRNLLPLTIEIASKLADYHGASIGNWKEGKSYDNAANNRVRMFKKLRNCFRPANVRESDWNNGVNFVEYFDRADLYWPAMQTVYDNDTSVLNSLKTIVACVSLQRAGQEAQRMFSGNSSLTNAQYASEVVKYINKKVVKNGDENKTIICCEITYNEKDHYDLMKEEELIEKVKEQFVSLGFTNDINDILDTKIVKLPEVYPMFFVGYQDELSKTKMKTDSISNMYTIGSLAEYAYADLQVLFSKAIYLAEVLTNKTFQINKIDKTIPVILLSAFTDTKYLLEATKLKLVDYLTKPVDFKTLNNSLQSCVEEILDNSRYLINFQNSIQYNVLHNQEKYKSVLKKYYELREKYVEKGSIPLNKKEAFSFELLEYIEAQDIAKENPIISIIFLAINQIIDNKYIDNPCNVLKLKKGKSLDENIHNIYSDLSIPNLISRLEFEGKGDIKITFLTLDKALSSYMEIFKFNYISEIKKNTGYLKLHQVEVEIQSKLIRSFFKNLFENWEASKNNSHSISSTKPSNKTE